MAIQGNNYDTQDKNHCAKKRFEQYFSCKKEEKLMLIAKIF